MQQLNILEGLWCGKTMQAPFDFSKILVFYITLFRSITMFVQATIFYRIFSNIRTFNLNVKISKNIVWNTINLTKYCYGFEECYALTNLLETCVPTHCE